MPAEYFDVIDEEDRVVGRSPGSECVRKGLLHRAIAILLFDEQGRVYLQKRADSMTWYPGHWTLSVMGHVSSGETYEQAAARELSEELGLSCELRYVSKTRGPDWRYGEMLERETVAVFEGRVAGPRITLSDETQEGRFVRFDEFAEMVRKEPDRLTPDTLLAFEVYMKAGSGSRRSERR